MEEVKWSKEFETGIHWIDTQHKSIINRIDKMNKAIDNNRGEIEVDKMLVYLDESCRRYTSEGRMNSFADLRAAISEGAVERVRPLLMTVATTLIGLLPIMFGTETGTRVMKRIAAPMVGGLISSTLLTLIVLPARSLPAAITV